MNGRDRTMATAAAGSHTLWPHPAHSRRRGSSAAGREPVSSRAHPCVASAVLRGAPYQHDHPHIGDA